MKVLYTNLRFNWNDAIDYAFNKDMLIPSKEQAKKLGIPKGFWTSTTEPTSFTKAWATGERLPTYKLSALRNVVLVERLDSEQRISYRMGDVTL